VPVKSQIADTDDTLWEAQFWLPAYAALCMALLAVFALPHSLSEPDPHKEIPQARLYEQAVAVQTRAFNDIRAFIVQNAMDAGVETLLDGSSITLRLPERMLFTAETEQFLPAGFHTLNQLKELFLIQSLQTIHIRGYTDDSPLPPGARFKDNWELSALRAAHVLRHLLAQGIEPWRLTATGFGELEPLFPNTTEENRSKNRRIEFMLERRLGKE
jgi:chemotaxis protein MotB